jgi:hypothetical protein
LPNIFAKVFYGTKKILNFVQFSQKLENRALIQRKYEQQKNDDFFAKMKFLDKVVQSNKLSLFPQMKIYILLTLTLHICVCAGTGTPRRRARV